MVDARLYPFTVAVTYPEVYWHKYFATRTCPAVTWRSVVVTIQLEFMHGVLEPKNGAKTWPNYG